MNLGLSAIFSESMDKVESKTIELLKEVGFGILTEIDVKATLKKKINVDRLPYKILGACHPRNANKVLNADPDLGLLLPCNVILYEMEGGKTKVSLINPAEMFSLVDNKAVEPIANDVNDAFNSVLNKLKDSFE